MRVRLAFPDATSTSVPAVPGNATLTLISGNASLTLISRAERLGVRGAAPTFPS